MILQIITTAAVGHILEHHAAGMMALFEVVDPANPVGEKTKAPHSCHV